MRLRHILPALFLALVPFLAQAAESRGSYGFSPFGELKYAKDFKHFDYVNADAPKGGMVRLASVGTFDTLNPFTLRGMAGAGAGSVFDTLMIPSEDEISAQYGLIAHSVELAPDRKSILYRLRPEARFHDGSPIGPEDVVFTFETLKEKGHPSYRIMLAEVVKAEKTGEHEVKFSFANGNNREVPLYVGQLPILSKKYWQGKKFEDTTLDAPLGSGPYKVAAVEPGRSITYERVKDYWAKDLPVRRGSNNFDTIRYDYYRDMSVSLEAFKAGQFDWRQEYTAKDWATGYDVPAVKDGRIVKEQIPNGIPAGMQGFVFNTRKPLFQDRRVREALNYAFDFEWANKTLMYDAYHRTESWFANSVFASSGLPAGEELAILEKYRGRVPETVFTQAFELPKTDGSGNIRDNLRKGLQILKDAGWSFKEGKLVNDKTGQNFAFEILYDDQRMERIILPFKQNLERMGITAQLRLVDPAQYQNRVRDFDYEMITTVWGPSLPPGNELRDMFSAEAANTPGTANYMGVADPVVDALVEEVVSAQKIEPLTIAARALDRVLLSNQYVIPQWYAGYFRVAYWNKFGRPATPPKYGIGFDQWWIDPALESGGK